MCKRLGTFLAAVAAACFVHVHVAYGIDSPRPLHGKEMKTALLGNTLIGADGEDGVSSVYFPSADILWGQSPTGDVDIGHWWVENDSYCRAWRRWLRGEAQCWQLASADDGRIFWYSLDGGITGRSLLWHGNALGALPDQLSTQTADQADGSVADLDGPQVSPATSRPRSREQAESEQGITTGPVERGADLHVRTAPMLFAATDSNSLRMRPLSSTVWAGGMLDGAAMDARTSLDLPREALSVEAAPAPAPAPEPEKTGKVARAGFDSYSERSRNGSGLAHDSSGGGTGGANKNGGTDRD